MSCSKLVIGTTTRFMLMPLLGMVVMVALEQTVISVILNAL